MLIAQSCPSLCDLMDCSPPGPPSMAFPWQEYCSGLPFPSPGDLPNPGIKPGSPILQADSLPSGTMNHSDLFPDFVGKECKISS